MRETYGRTLVELGKENTNIVVLDSDVAHSTKTIYFGREFPERFFNFGIQEANMMDAAAGLATEVPAIPLQLPSSWTCSL